nr:uncharacterized protein LOC123763219 [Procambarus clarkii]XP_045606231.1 uncharacterized protein LOC123763219 [Procambarus clarkii]XP_045606232.1 uncharacterized protein LOC123763219 [Procambarus clarkii]XP_045606233.1 uncharacterized protein LOC123763219 [Procambarus clarkii]
MSRQRQLGGINSLDILQIKAFKFLNCEGRQALWYIFSIACQKPETQTLHDYFINEVKMEEGHFIRRFFPTQLSKIESDPSGKDFDITLLFKCLGLPLSGLSKCGSEAWSSDDETKLECLISKVKDQRNDLSHIKEIKSPSELEEYATTVTDLLSKTYKLAGEKYDRDQDEVNECISEMEKQIDFILRAPLKVIADDHLQIMLDLKAQQETFVLNASTDLRRLYEVTSKIHPASFMTHTESLQVQSVYSKVEVVEERHKYKKTFAIDHDSLLELRTYDEKVPSVIIVEGEAGMGKTTLIKLILAEWANLPDSPNTIHGLDKYELILHSECRNQSISTFLDLLNVLLGQSSLLLSKEELLHSVLSKKTLVLLDGVDEWNQNSKKLLLELVDRRIPESGDKLQLLCTTRPEKVDELLSHLKVSWVHTRIQGIHPDKQNEFIIKFMEVLTQHTNIDPRTPVDLHTKIQGLKNFLQCSRTKMGEQFKLPLNLALLTFLWVNNSEDISIVKTTTELYAVFHDLGQKRLIQRLVHRQENRSKRDWENLCNGFLCVLYKECLIALSRVAMQMPKECTQTIETYCKREDLPISDLLENYMEVYREWDVCGYLTVLAPPHKSKLEFFSAHGVINEICINHDVQKVLIDLQNLLVSHNVSQDIMKDILEFASNKLKNENPKTIRHVLESLHSTENELDIKQYQNMLIMMAGIMSKNHENDLHTYGPELLELLKMSGLSSHQFLNIVAETKHDKFIAELVAKNLDDKTLEVSDGHIGSALAVLPHLAESTEVKIKLQGDPKYLPDIQDLLLFVASRSCMVSLILEHLLHVPDTSADHLLKLLQNSRCKLLHLEGHLSSSAVIPNTVEQLDLSAATGSSNPALPNLDHLSNLFHLDIHILRGVIPKHLQPLPSLPERSSGITLNLYDVGDMDVEWANEVVRALCPIKSKEYDSLVFWRSQLSADGCKTLVKALADPPSIKLEDTLKVSSKTLNTTDQEVLLKHTKKNLRCKFTLLR